MNSSCLAARRQLSSKETATCQPNHYLKFSRRLSATQFNRQTSGMDSSSTILSTPPSQSFLSSSKVPMTWSSRWNRSLNISELHNLICLVILELKIIQHRWWQNQLRRSSAQQSHGPQPSRSWRRFGRQSRWRSGNTFRWIGKNQLGRRKVLEAEDKQTRRGVLESNRLSSELD